MNAAELQDIVKGIQSDENLPLLDIAEGWLHWFKKRGDRCLKDAAKLGYSEATLDLPIEIAQKFDLPALRLIQKELREFLEGFTVGFVEDEYEEKPLCRLHISWK